MIQVLCEIAAYLSAEIGVAVERSLVTKILDLRNNLFLNIKNAPYTWKSSMCHAVEEITKIAMRHAALPGPSTHATSDEVAILKKELNMSRNELLATKEELLATKEELKAAKQEIKSVKDELEGGVKRAKNKVKVAKNELKEVKEELKEVKAELKEVKAELKAEKNKV